MLGIVAIVSYALFLYLGQEHFLKQLGNAVADAYLPCLPNWREGAIALAEKYSA